MKHRCLRCAQNHDTRECTKSEQDIPTCANCGEAHRANFKECPKLIEYQQNLERRKAPPKVPAAPTSESFPTLPKRAWNNQPKAANPNRDDSKACLTDIISIFTSGSWSIYMRKIRDIIHEFRQQTDTCGKLTNLCNGIMDLFNIHDGSN